MEGITSATYIGERTETAPTDNPPIMRKKINKNEVVAIADPIHERAKNKATTIRTPFRPNRSVRTPEIKEPTMAPTINELTPQPNCNSLHPK